MQRNHLIRAAAVVFALAMPLVASAQERGRTDGPEGSEFGKGGYSGIHENIFSAQIDWGASMVSGRGGAPIFIGATGTYWNSEIFLVDLSLGYSVAGSRTFALIGPRLRTGTMPMAFSVGLKTGGILDRGQGVRFALSPTAGFDYILKDKVILALNYAPDIPIGAALPWSHRVYMSIGYRF